jgi:hypothetical protein
MNQPTLRCKDEQRRDRVRQQSWNGLDYLEVSDDQRSLCVYFLGSVPDNIAKDNVRIEGGQRIRDLQVTDVQPQIQDDPTLDSYLKVFVDRAGDFSTYTLRLVKSELDDRGQLQPLDGFDPRYAQLQFSFKAGCPSDLDCKSQPVCPPVAQIEPEINYLAKDYASFRQLILDRLAALIPDWQERHVPDIGITLVELLAYVGDYLSYYQDAVATEAYLDTARQRISVRRHARLVDYLMHEGCNARTWVWLETSHDIPLDLNDIYFITRYHNASATGTILRADDLKNIPTSQYEVFEPIFLAPQAQIQLHQAHNQIYFYTWGDRQCCLPKGATAATLLDRQLQLKCGDILIFEEIKGAKTGNIADADASHRHAVRLTRVHPTQDELYKQQVQNVDREMPTPLLEIEWAAEDALPFPLCISAIGPAPECVLMENISVARGNVILVDYGRKVEERDLGTVPEQEAIATCESEGQPTEIVSQPGLFRPHLKSLPLTFSHPLSDRERKTAPASRLLVQDPRQALPQIVKLTGKPASDANNSERPDWLWMPQSDLLGSNSQDRHFVVEMDNEGIAHLRFGDGELGQMPAAGTQFSAIYRIGNGTSGNIGAETIAHLVCQQSQLSGIAIAPHNPFAAQGGTPPEPLSEVKLFAPHAFRRQLQRAITAQDYADIVMRDFKTQVQRAAAILCWTGSWYEVLVAIDPLGTETASEKLLEAIAKHLYRYRRIGHDVVVAPAVRIPLEIEMVVCVKPDYLRGHVKAALLDIFSHRILPDGRRGFFHPDNLTFGEGIALSKLVAIALTVTGVESVSVTKLQRLFQEPNRELESGILSLGMLEIARLDNDPTFPENGILKLEMAGGR